MSKVDTMEYLPIEKGYLPPEDQERCFFPKCELTHMINCEVCGIGICSIHWEYLAMKERQCPTCKIILGEPEECSSRGCKNVLYLNYQYERDILKKYFNIELAPVQHCDICGKQNMPLCAKHFYCSDKCKDSDDYGG